MKTFEEKNIGDKLYLIGTPNDKWLPLFIETVTIKNIIKNYTDKNRDSMSEYNLILFDVESKKLDENNNGIAVIPINSYAHVENYCVDNYVNVNMDVFTTPEMALHFLDAIKKITDEYIIKIKENITY